MDTDLAAVSLSTKIPEFWTDQPRAWFAQIEALLAPQKLGDEARYNIVLTKLGKDAIIQVTDLIMNPVSEEKYATLKDRLLKIFEESETRQLQKLIGEMDLGEQKPSQLLRRMRELARGKIPNDTLRLLWQGHLPTSVRAVLAIVDGKDLEYLSSIADKVMESARSPMINELKASTSGTSEYSIPGSSTDTGAILLAIANLSLKVMELEQARPRGRSPWRHNRPRSRPASRNRNKSINRRDQEGLCYYHERFREKAYRCREPCTWTSKEKN